MKKIYWFIIKSYLGPLFMTFFIALFILLMQFLWKYVDDMVGKGLEWYVIAELLFYASSTFVPMALPLAILLSSLMTFGNLGENYELVALKAAGISLRRVMMPLIGLSIGISLIAFYFSNNVLPVANLKFKSLLYDVREQKLALDIKEGVFYDGLDGFVIRAAKKEKDEKTLRDVLIYDHTEGKGNTNVTIADSGRMELSNDGRYMIFTLFNGYNYTDRTDQKNSKVTKPFRKTKFRENFRKFDLLEFEMNRTDQELFRNNYSMLNLRQLEEAEDSLVQQLALRHKDIPDRLMRSFYFLNKIDSTQAAEFKSEKPLITNVLSEYNKQEKDKIIDEALMRLRRNRTTIGTYKKELESKSELVYKHQAEWHKKFTLSFACFILFFVGAPLGAIIRKGGLGMPVVVSVLLFVGFHIISITSEKSVKSGVIDANIGMWIASFVLLPLGVFLTMKATTDSPLLDADAWRKLFKKLTFKKN